MKKIILIAATILLAAFTAFAISFSGQTLSVPKDSPLEIAVIKVPPIDIKIKAIRTGSSVSRAMFSFRGGSFNDQRRFVIGAFLIEHPQGLLLIDAGFGRDTNEHLKLAHWAEQKLSRVEKGKPIGQQLKAAGIEPASLRGIILTHAHWDHLSGLSDLRGVPVLINRAELNFINGSDRATAVARKLDIKDYRVHEFADGPYLGFPASHDIFGDASVVVVPAPGHTPGSVIVFVSISAQLQYAFVGDLAWQKEGIDLPAERPWPVRSLADREPENVRKWIVHMHQLQKRIPTLMVVPAHDERVWNMLPQL